MTFSQFAGKRFAAAESGVRTPALWRETIFDVQRQFRRIVPRHKAAGFEFFQPVRQYAR